MTIFANVKDITIPEGNVKKIQESISGRVLWEKKKKYDIDILESVAGFFKHNNSYQIRRKTPSFSYGDIRRYKVSA